QVTVWLKKIYGDMPIPDYEVNEKTVDILYDFMERSEARNRDVSLLIEEMKHHATEYQEQTKEIQDILRESLGLSLTSLSSKATKSLNDLRETAMTLESEDTSLTSFFCAINNRAAEWFEMKSENREMKREWNTKTKKLTSALELQRWLQQDVRNLETHQRVKSDIKESQSKKITFLRQKSLEFQVRIKASGEELVARGLDKTITHHGLLELSEELAELQKKVTSLKKDLEIYHDLLPVI
ncbi:HAUS1 protein, partial [Pitta sordida]|nr:HAUS1 protein [Pitta sordida]